MEKLVRKFFPAGSQFFPKVEAMRDHFSLLISPILVLLGAVLVYDGAVSQDSSQSARVIAGATLLALGLVLVQLTLKAWWKEKTRTSRNPSRES